MAQTVQKTGLVDGSGTKLDTPVWGYGTLTGGGKANPVSWPGPTFQVRKDEPLCVLWESKLPLQHLLTSVDGESVVDKTLHWAYALEGYDHLTIEQHGVPVVPHVHGAHTDFQYDGNPEFFFSSQGVKGPQYRTNKYTYDNDQNAAAIWYHDHALGITRLNVHAGLAGFYIIRDEFDTGLPDNPLNLPANDYESGKVRELALAIQDRMFKDNGELFYPAFQGDPFYEDFITGEGANWTQGKPTALAEFFGDHFVVNGKIWPKATVDPALVRLRLLNGCDSRFLVIRFYEEVVNVRRQESLIPFTVIGGDQGFVSDGSNGIVRDTLVMETGSRYDILFDFRGHQGKRIIMKNIGGDEPFGGTFPGIA
eukprot:scaffold42409_cov214-Amphora_coffeaeformis.AAC.1